MTAEGDWLDWIEGRSAPKATQVLDGFLSRMRDMAGAERAALYVVGGGVRRPTLQLARLTGARRPARGGPSQAHLAPAEPLAQALRTARPLLWMADADTGERSPAMAAPVRSLYCLPLKGHGGAVVGVIELINLAGGADARAVQATVDGTQGAATLARLIGGMIERGQMVDKIRAKNVLLARRYRLLRDQRHRIAALQAETEQAFQTAIALLARGAEIHDEGTGNHIVRVNEYSYFLARLAGQPEPFCDEIRYSAQLHDIGKMSIDAALLKKRGRLTPAERKEMDSHTRYGHRILQDVPRLAMAAEIAYCHHEKWDGSGYPRRLRHDAIPLSARIVAIADVYDALRAERPYKPGHTHAETVRIMRDGDGILDPGRHFDPALLALFLGHHAGMDGIWRRFHD
jgi:HD-GYP domain-containing protein (c-di-GMP phosphodiesterase class II)